MRQETNNEIDLLLRRLSRGQGATAPDGDLHDHRDHLDADELNSYAENALPAAARAHYTEHLAECSRCRELVVQLSSAAGVVVAEEPARVPAPSGLRKFLASLFSPMVLRYAVPALGLIVVAVIGLTVVRRERPGSSPEMVAESRQAETPTAAVGVNTQRVEGFQDKQDKPAGFVSVTPEPRRGQTEAEPPAPIATPAAAANTPADAVKEAPVAKVESTTVATAAPPPAAPKPAEASDENKKREPEAQKQQEQARVAASPQTETALQAGASTGSVASTRRAAKRADSAQDRGAVAPMPLQLGDKDKVDDGETRTVAGRRFRKQRGIWVDTAYAGGATVDLTRGSEQYRSLVADEPEIKKIAEQLDGQIIVVWKGRSYRIR